MGLGEEGLSLSKGDGWLNVLLAARDPKELPIGVSDAPCIVGEVEDGGEDPDLVADGLGAACCGDKAGEPGGQDFDSQFFEGGAGNGVNVVVDDRAVAVGGLGGKGGGDGWPVDLLDEGGEGIRGEGGKALGLIELGLELGFCFSFSGWPGPL